ncbi:glycoside hydrolase family 71 protein [Marasmius fiardii PR-910]|nr:glycoside hydrolase family 71 protein [Marasmius fiardii PR-910]
MTSLFITLLIILALSRLSSPYHYSPHHVQVFAHNPNDSGNPRLVFAHFMIGIVSNRQSSADYDTDISLAKSFGIDAFALNIGTDTSSDTQLSFAYNSAAKNNFKVFISFDCNYYHPGTESDIGSKIAKYANLPGQLKLADGSVFVSTFLGDGLDVAAVRRAAGTLIYFAPNFHPDWPGADFSGVDAAFNWMGWQHNGRNKAPTVVNGEDAVTVDDGDKMYLRALGYGDLNRVTSQDTSGFLDVSMKVPNKLVKRGGRKGYLAPLSPWFFTHYGGEVSYSKNWVFPGGLLIYLRWLEILALQPSFVEIISWNDYGESHYVGPLSSKHHDDGASKWINDMPHTGWLTLSKPFIAAYQAGHTTVDPFITSDQLIYWYRITPQSQDCDSTDTTTTSANNDSGNFFHGRPNGYQTLQDNIFIVSLLTSPGTVNVNSGGTLYTYDAPSGPSAFAVPFQIGSQRFSLVREGIEVIGETSLKEIKNECPCGMYNFNPYVGVVPPSALGGGRDTLTDGDKDAYEIFKDGLKVGCEPKPSLASSPPPTQAITKTVVTSAAPTNPPI